MTLTDYLADYRTKFPKAAGIPDADLVQMVSVKSDFNPAWLQQPVEAAPVAAPAPGDTSFKSALLSGVAQPVAAIGESAQVLGEVAGSEALKGVGEYLSQAKGLIPQGYKSASEEFVKSWDLSLLPRAVTEQSGQLLGSVASRLAGGAIGGLFAAPSAGVSGPVGPAAGVVVGQAIAPALFEGLQLLGSVARERARNDGRTEVTKDDLVVALGTSAVSGALNSIGDRYLGGKGATYLKRLKEAVLGEGVTEMGQGIVEQVGGSVATKAGVQVDLKQAAAEGVLGAGSAGVFTTAMEPFVQGEAVPTAPAAAPAAKPVFSYGDIQPPTVERPDYVATATVEGEELQFLGATEEQAAAKRDAYIKEITAVPASEEGAVEKAPEVVDELAQLGLTPEQIRALTPQDAIAVLERVEAARPALFQGAEAEAEYARSEVRKNILKNAADAERLNLELAVQQAKSLQEKEAASAKLAKIKQRVATLEAGIADTKAKAALAKAEAAEAAARKAQADEATSAAKSSRKWNEGVALRGDPVTGVETVRKTDMLGEKMDGSEQAAQAEGVPSGTVKVAAPAVTAGPAVEVKKEEPAAPKPFVAPKQTIAPALEAGVPAIYYPEVGAAPEISKGMTKRANARYAAVFADAQGNRIAVPVIRVGDNTDLLVFLDSRGVKEALGNVIGGNLNRDAKVTAAKAAEVGYPLDNKKTLAEYAASRGLTFMDAFIRSDTKLDAGEYALPAGLAVVPSDTPSVVAPAPKKLAAPSPKAMTEMVEPALMLLRKEFNNDLKALKSSLAASAEDPRSFFAKYSPQIEKLLSSLMESDAAATAAALFKSLGTAADADQAPIAATSGPVGQLEGTLSAEGKMEYGIGLTVDKADNKGDPLFDAKAAEEAKKKGVSIEVKDPAASLAKMTPLSDLGSIQEAPTADAGEAAARESFKKGDYTRAEAEFRAAARAAANSDMEPKSKTAALGRLLTAAERTHDLALAVFKAAGVEAPSAIPPLAKAPANAPAPAIRPVVERVPQEGGRPLTVEEAYGLFSILDDASLRVPAGKKFGLMAVVDAIARAGKSKSTSPIVNGMKAAKITPKQLFDIFNSAMKGALTAAGLDKAKLGEAFISKVQEVNVTRLTEETVAQTNRPLSEPESRELNGYRGETDTVQFLRNLAARGVNVSFTDLKNAVAGRFSEGHVAIFANWADRASASTFGVALHEATHHFVSQLPPAARLALHRSVDQLTGRLMGRTDVDPRVGYKSYAEYQASKPEQVLSPSAWAEEVIAETAALNGMDRAVSRTAWAMIVRQVKLLALRVNMYLQEQFMGPDGVNPEFVSKWVDAQIDATIAGDALRMGSFMDRFIGLRPTLGEMAINHVDPRNVWQSSAMDPVTGQVTYVTPLGTSSSAIQTAIMMSVESLKQDALLTGAWNRDANLQALAEVMQTNKPAPTGAVQANTSLMLRFAKRAADSKVAAALEISKPFEAAFAKLAALMPEISEASRNLARRRGETLPESVTREYVANLIGHNLSEKVIADAQETLARIMKTETGVDAPPDLVSAKTTLDTLTDISTRHKAHVELQRVTSELARVTATKEVAAREALLKAEDVQLRTAALLAKYVTDPADWTQHAQHISASIAEAFEQISKDQALLTKKEAQVSDVSSMLRQMETSTEARASMDKNVQEMLAKVSIDNLSLNSIMRELLSLETSTAHKIDFSQSVKVIRETVLAYVKANPTSSLAVLTTQQGSGDLRGSALLSALITYVRRNELAVDLMRSTLVKGNLELAALAEFQSVMRASTDKKLDALAALQTAQRELPTNRFVQKALNTRDKFTRAADDVVQLKRDLAVLKTMSGTFAQAQKLAESELNVIGDLYIHGPTATFAHPTSVNDSIDKVYEPSRVKTVGEMSDADLRKVIADVRAYLEANKNRPESQGHLFNKLQRQNTAMTTALVGDGPKSAMASIFNARLRGFAESFLGAGVKGGDRLAARVSRYSSLVSQWGTKVKKISSEYERNLASFLKAGGIKDFEDFYDSFYTPATGLAQVYPGERTEVQAQIDRLLSENAATKDAWAKPGAKKAFWSFLDSCEKGMSALAEMQKESGADLVSDPEMVNPATKEKGAYRKQIRRGWLTFPMHTAKPLKAWANSVPLKFQDSSQVSLFTNPLAELGANAAQNRAEMAEFLGRDGWREFMQPLLTNDLSGTPGPKHADGERYSISTAMAKTLAAKADGDFFRFAELVHRESDTTESLEDFTSALIKHVGTVWNQVNSQTRELAPTTSSLFQSPGIPNIGLDARVTQTWPIGWKASMEFNDAAMRRASSGIAAASAFGRDMSEALVDLAAMDNEIGNKLKEIEGRYTARGISLREQMLAKRSPLELSKLGIGTTDWQQYQALKGYQDVKWKENLIGVLNSDNTIGLSDPTAMALWGTYVMNLTAGFRSALKNPTSLLNQFALAGEFSADSAMDTLGNYGQLFKQIASSVTGSVIPFYKPGSNDVNIQAMKLAGVYDPITDVRLLDSLKGGRGAGGDTPPLVRNMRRISEVLKDTRLGFGFGKDIVSLRAFDWFGWTQLLTQLSAVNNNLNIYYEIVQSMASYGRAGGDLSQPLTTKQLGLRGSDTRLTSMLAAFTQAGGADMLTLASEIATNPKMSELEIKQRLVPTVNKITSDRISSEGSISSNPAWLSSSKVGRVGGTFVGFQLRQMGNLVKPFIDAQTNKVSAPTLLRGAGMVALGMMPGIIAYSMMLDMWDDLTEKKRDKLQLRLGSEQTGEQRLQALIEAFNDVGALSFMWEVPNQVINAYQGTAGRGALLSVDNRVVAISALNNFIRTFRDTWEYGFENLTMSTTGMQALNALGLQAQIGNLDTVNRLTKGFVEQVPVLGGFVSSAAERQDRISVNNYIREAGRAERLPVRQYGSTVGGNVPSKMNPHIVDMQLAALEKDEARFDRAKALAFEEAQKVTPFANPAEAWKTVVSKYTRKHPLRGNFSNPLTQEQINTLLNNIEKNYPGKAATIKQSLTDFNSMGARKLPGFKPVVGTNKPSMAARETIVAEKQGKTVAEFRKELAKAREPKW